MVDPFQSHHKVPSLKTIALRTCERHYAHIDDVGGIQFDLLYTILRRCSSDQLRLIELKSPHLVADTPKIWKEWLYRDFPEVAAKESQKSVTRNSDPVRWRRAYREASNLRDLRHEEAQKKVKARFAEEEKVRNESKTIKIDYDPRIGWANGKFEKRIGTISKGKSPLAKIRAETRKRGGYVSPANRSSSIRKEVHVKPSTTSRSSFFAAIQSHTKR